MWTIVLFTDENTIEAIPSHWVKKDNTCAWPKKNIKKHVERRTIPNSFDFNFYPSRVIKKNIGTLLEARTKLKRAENTSDLSTTEECYTIRKTQNVSKIPDPPIYSSKNINNDDNNVFHKYNTGIKSINSEQSIISPKHNRTRVKRQLYDLSSSDEAEPPKYDSYSPALIRSKIQCTRTNNIIDSSYSEKPTTIGSNLQSPQYDIISGQVNEKHNKTEDLFLSFRQSEDPNVKVYQTTSSPFKVTNMENVFNRSEIIKDNNLHFVSTSPADTFKTPPMINNNDPKLKTVQSKHKYPTKSASILPTPFSTVDSTLGDTVKRILHVVLKIRYDLETLAQKQHHMDETMSEMVLKFQNNATSNNEQIITMSNQEDCDTLFPISNEEELIEFETKLLDNNFKTTVVNSLKRLTRKTLTSTVRQMLRKLFDDELLKEYSYVGQKKKRIFSSLKTCTVIFEAVRRTKHFQNAIDAEIEAPIKVYIAGAAFRNKKDA